MIGAAFFAFFAWFEALGRSVRTCACVGKSQGFRAKCACVL